MTRDDASLRIPTNARTTSTLIAAARRDFRILATVTAPCSVKATEACRDRVLRMLPQIDIIAAYGCVDYFVS